MKFRVCSIAAGFLALLAVSVYWGPTGVGAPAGVAQSAPPEKQATAVEAPVYFEDIKPILDRNCTGCHAWTKTAAGLVEKKSDSAPTRGLRIVYPAKPDSSVLIWRLEGKLPSGRTIALMPKGRKKLDDASISRVRTWIAQGANERSPEKKK